MADKTDSLTPSANTNHNAGSLSAAVEVDRYTEIAELKSNALSACNDAQASASSAAEARDDTIAAKEQAQAKLEELNTISTQCLAAKTKIEDWQTVVATKSGHIEDAQKHADDVRANLDRALTSANQSVTDAEAIKTKAQSALENASQVLTEIRTTKTNSDAEFEAIKTSKEEAEESSAAIKSLAEKAATVEERVAAYEKRLAEMDTQHKERLKAIVDLLPGATSAGLAKDFLARGQTFKKPHMWWQIIFVVSVLANVLLAGIGMWHFIASGVAPSYDELYRLLLTRFPVAGFLIWLAIHASREAALAKRLEEDYGFKAATASSFFGFNQQMAEVSAEAGKDTPLAQLCSNTLSIIAAPPGRIYEKHPLAFSPTDEVRKLGTMGVEALKGNKP